MVRQQHIVIVGAGIVGLSTAYSLLTRGVHNVTILEQETVDHIRSSSHGFSRLLRFEYGSDAFYSHMVRSSLKRWKNLEYRTGQTLYTSTGLLMLGNDDDRDTLSSYRVVREMGLPIERLSQDACASRFPQFDRRPYNLCLYNQEAGILHASTILQTLRDLILDLGGEIYESCRVTRITNENQYYPIRLHLSSGQAIQADRIVLAAGPWIHRLLPHLYLPVRITRQYLIYFSGLPISDYSTGTFPAFIAGDIYGFPIHQGCNSWVKATSHTFGVPIDPDNIALQDNQVISSISAQIRELLPALQHAEIARVDSCMYDVSPDEDFILDRLPSDPRIIVATGLSGHAFKFGLLLGDILSNLVSNTEPPVPLDRFRLSRFSHARKYQKSSVA
ncbi:MAG TPA: N-methyl-L-tryptophan oxidase [Ktedonobacteraceae bacterium]|nr:N-methyl-L-tryptophan oxidase [Ktedonobacteraceae bacterium]